MCECMCVCVPHATPAEMRGGKMLTRPQAWRVREFMYVCVCVCVCVLHVLLQGTLPSLSRGDDDIMWVSRLQRALVGQGFYPSDEECEEWLFGEATQEAVLSAQASGGLPETGGRGRGGGGVHTHTQTQTHRRHPGASAIVCSACRQ